MDGDDLEPAVDLRRDRAAAGIALDLDLAERFNRVAQLAGVPHQFREHSQFIEHVPFSQRGVLLSFDHEPCLNRSSKQETGTAVGGTSVSRRLS